MRLCTALRWTFNLTVPMITKWPSIVEINIKFVCERSLTARQTLILSTHWLYLPTVTSSGPQTYHSQGVLSWHTYIHACTTYKTWKWKKAFFLSFSSFIFSESRSECKVLGKFWLHPSGCNQNFPKLFFQIIP